MLTSSREVIRCLITYSDWWQPASGSVFRVGAARRSKNLPEGFRPGLIETLDERTELKRRVGMLEEIDRKILFLWYVKQLPAGDIAREVGRARRTCFRRRSKAIDTLVDLGEAA